MPQYDYVIVGAGSAGCVLANRLSEDPDCQVLLVEAGGPDTSDFIHIPAAFSALYRSGNDWDLGTGWEPGLNDRRVFLPRGKTLGGSSSINAMIYIRGNAADYDEWSDMGWGWDDLLPYFVKAEDNVRGASELHGAGGPLRVSDSLARTGLSQAFLDAAAAKGLPASEDFNGPQQDGFGWYQQTTRDGKRGSTAVSYLHPVMDRPNLTVETHVHVHNVVFDGTRATGHRRRRGSARCSSSTPRPRSSSAPAPTCRRRSCGSRASGGPTSSSCCSWPRPRTCPASAWACRTTPTAGGTWLTKDPISLKDALNDENLALWMGGGGPLSSNGVEAGGFLRTRDGLDAPDVQFHMVSAMFEQEGLRPAAGARVHAQRLRRQAAEPRAGRRRVARPDDEAVHRPQLLRRARGHALGRRGPADRDGDRGDRAARRAGRRAAHGARRRPPTPSSRPTSARPAQTIYHPTSTCRMGADDLAVCDAELRVRGVEGLRVVDASVFPSVPRGNTNAPTIALAERAADLIRGRTPERTGAQTEAAGAR